MKENTDIWLGSENISKGGYISNLKCSKCDNVTFHLRLNAEMDSNYMGVVGLTDSKNKRLVITHLNSEEWQNWEKGIKAEIEQRVNDEFNCKDFEFFEWNYFEYNNEKTYHPTCSNCSSFLNQTGHLSFYNFVKSGGKIISIDTFRN
jgi:hypothetical protein